MAQAHTDQEPHRTGDAVRIAGQQAWDEARKDRSRTSAACRIRAGLYRASGAPMRMTWVKDQPCRKYPRSFPGGAGLLPAQSEAQAQAMSGRPGGSEPPPRDSDRAAAAHCRAIHAPRIRRPETRPPPGRLPHCATALLQSGYDRTVHRDSSQEQETPDVPSAPTIQKFVSGSSKLISCIQIFL